MNWGTEATYQMVKTAVTEGANYNSIFAVVKEDVKPLVTARSVPEHEREDVLQEIYITVLQRLAPYVKNSAALSPAQRNSWLRTLAERRIADFWRGYYREEREVVDTGDASVSRLRKVSLSLFDGEDGEERDIPQEQQEFVRLEEEDPQRLYRLLTLLFSIRTTPDKLLAFIFNKIILADYAGIVKNKTTAIATRLKGKKLGVIYAAVKIELPRTLDVAIPDEVFAPLRDKLAEEKDGIAYYERTFDLSPRAITDSSNWLKGRWKEQIQHE